MPAAPRPPSQNEMYWNADVDVAAQPGLGDRARRGGGVEQLRRRARRRRRAAGRSGSAGRRAPRRTRPGRPPTTSGCATQVPSKPAPASRALSSRDRVDGPLVGLRVAAGRDQRRHAAHRERAAAVAGGDQQLGVGAHERHRHLHVGPVRQHELGPVAERLDHREDVVPAAGVEPVRVVAQLVEDLLHLERGRQRLDQHGGADRPRWKAERLLGERRTRRSTAAPRGGAPSSAGTGTARCRGPAGGWPLWNANSPKSISAPGDRRRRRRAGASRRRCQPRGRTSSVAGLLDQLVVPAVGRVVGDRALDRVDRG